MTMPAVLAQLFLEPVAISGGTRLALLAPLAASIALVYKTLRCARMRDVPLASLTLWITINVGMMAVGVALLIAFRVLL